MLPPTFMEGLLTSVTALWKGALTVTCPRVFLLGNSGSCNDDELLCHLEVTDCDGGSDRGWR